ncbi:COG4223 family protein [Caulobacter sp. LARHSG274]
MNAAPDPADIAAPQDPALYARRHVLGPGFWALIAFGVICVAAGAGLARFGPTWFAGGKAPAAAEPPPAAAAPPARLDPPPAVPPQARAEPAPTQDVARLEGRVAQLEAGQQRALDAAAAALAAATLADAAGTSRPFADELSSLERVLPLSPDLRGLARLAQDGAPTRAGLAAAFEALSARAAVAGRAPGRDADFLAKLRHALSSIVSIRQVASTQGSTPDAVLNRAQKLLNEGDVEGGLAALEPLPASAQTVLASWRAAAERRVEIDRHVAAIRADALAGLAEATRTPAPASGPYTTAPAEPVAP